MSDFGESVRRPTSGGLDDDSEDDSDEDGDDVKEVLGRLRRETAKTLKRQVYNAPDRIQQSVVGTADYLAPELIAAAAHDERVDGVKAPQHRGTPRSCRSPRRENSRA